MTQRCIVAGAAICLALAAGSGRQGGDGPGVQAAAPEEPNRSPVDVALSPEGRWLVTANQTCDTLSLIDAEAAQRVAEVPCGDHPAAVVFTPDGKRVLATASHSSELWVYALGEETLQPAGKVRLGFEPRGIAVSPDGAKAYVALSAGSAVAVVDLQSLAVASQIEVDAWPRYLALSPDGKRLAVGCSGKRTVAVIDTQAGAVLYTQSFEGINIGRMQTSADGTRVYAPWMVYRQNPITVQNIRIGWVLASRIGYIRLDGKARRFAISLDVPRQAMSDPYGLSITSDEEWLVCTSSGTHELLVYRLPTLPFQDTGGPGDVVDRQLAADSNRFYRVPLGGRPMGTAIAPDNRRVFVANYIDNCVQVVDLEKRQVAATIPLGGPAQPSLARQGEALFYDARQSLDQWYSCHSCHYEGGTNAVTMDTRNDGTNRTFKTVLSLPHVTRTPPWTWHGWQDDLHAAMHKSLTDTMLGPKPTDEQVEALLAYLDVLQLPPNPHRAADGGLTEAAARGKAVFESRTAGCANCHSGQYFTDGQIHDVGLGSPKDAYEGYNTPSLLGTYRKVRWLHHGRARSLNDLLTRYHDPAEVTGEGALTDEQRSDLIEYLKSL